MVSRTVFIFLQPPMWLFIVNNLKRLYSLVFMDFTALGITQNEAKAYEALLLLGKTSAGRLAKESSVPYGRIYTVLASLEEKGLVTVLPEKTKLYVPASPEALSDYIQKRKNDLEEVEQKIKEYKTLYDTHGGEAVQVAKGKHNFHALARQMNPAKKYSYSIKYLFERSPVHVQKSKASVKKGIDKKTLGRYDEETKKDYDFWKKIVKNQKPIENEGVLMAIRDDQTVLLGLIKSNTTLFINDAPFAKLMKTLFDNYYENN